MKKLISLTDCYNFCEKLEIFKSLFLIEIKKSEFCESISIDFKNREIDLSFYKEHKKYLYNISISKNSLTISKNVKKSEPVIIYNKFHKKVFEHYIYLNEYKKTINL